MRIAFVFPGQGSQSVGMLSGFAGNETVAGVMARAFAHGQYPACDARLVGRLL